MRRVPECRPPDHPEIAGRGEQHDRAEEEQHSGGSTIELFAGPAERQKASLYVPAAKMVPAP
jgi:hypothetical protein